MSYYLVWPMNLLKLKEFAGSENSLSLYHVTILRYFLTITRCKVLPLIFDVSFEAEWEKYLNQLIQLNAI